MQKIVFGILVSESVSLIGVFSGARKLMDLNYMDNSVVVVVFINYERDTLV